MNNPLEDSTVNPVEYVKSKFPGWRFVCIAAVERLQHFIRGDESGVQQALRDSPVLGKERIIVTRDTPVPEPLPETVEAPLEVVEEPVVDPVEAEEEVLTDLVDPDGDDFEDEEDDDEECEEEPAGERAAREALVASNNVTETISQQQQGPSTTTMNNLKKNKLNAAVTTAFASLTSALTKALKTTNIGLSLSPDNHNLSTVTADGNVAASFRIQRFPGSDPLLIVSKFSIEPAFRNSGLNRTLHQVLDAAAKNAGATGILATVREDNQIQNIVLEFTGWSPIQPFKNPATGAAVQIYYKEVGSN